MLPLRNYRSDILTPVPWTNGVNSRQCDSRRSDILRWYHVNKYRTTRENWWSELEPARKSSRRHVNTPWNTFYCGNCRQANQIRGFNKQNLSSKHEKGIPQCIFIFFFLTIRRTFLSPDYEKSPALVTVGQKSHYGFYFRRMTLNPKWNQEIVE